jgi:K+/H+ antiporter YhaU regulatory subunit KhtT
MIDGHTAALRHGGNMTICAKFDGRRIEDCTRGDVCVCANEKAELVARIEQVAQLTADCRGYRERMEKMTNALTLIAQKNKKMAEVLLDIAYPQRGSVAEGMIYAEDCAKFIQANFSLDDLS